MQISGISLGVGCAASSLIIISSDSNCSIVGTWSLHFIGHHPWNLLQRVQHSRMQESWKTWSHSNALRYSEWGNIGCWQTAHGKSFGGDAAASSSAARDSTWLFSSSTHRVLTKGHDMMRLVRSVQGTEYQIKFSLPSIWIWLVTSVCTLSLARIVVTNYQWSGDSNKFRGQ